MREHRAGAGRPTPRGGPGSPVALQLASMARAALAAVLLAALGAAPLAGAQGHHHQHHHHGHGADEEAPAVLRGAPLAPAPAGLTAVLEDKIRPAGSGRVAWQTFWKLCWQPVAGAQGYELRRLTSEGAPRRPERVADTCWRVEVAAGENEAKAGFYRRELMLQMQAAQASLRVRAAFADGRLGAWSAEHPVGEVAPVAR